jgi:hypothetical protein
MDEDSRKNYTYNEYTENDYDIDYEDNLDEQEKNEIFENNIFDLAIDIKFDLNEYTSTNILPIGEFIEIIDLVDFLKNII